MTLPSGCLLALQVLVCGAALIVGRVGPSTESYYTLQTRDYWHVSCNGLDGFSMLVCAHNSDTVGILQFSCACAALTLGFSSSKEFLV